ncbi:MAG TPA: flagellar biosynthesis protein FlhB [Succinivibrionaceae bacterium]|nr:flagellar biosynthesis protein FlhB [Succinivibrionaceae bacterium]
MEEQNKKAAALSYQDDLAAPILSAVGTGDRAEAILAMAKQEGIYIHKDNRLMDELAKYKEGEEIPKELFEIISTILAFSYILQGKTPEKWTDTEGKQHIKVQS